MNYILPVDFQTAHYHDRLVQFLKDYDDVFGLFIDRPDASDTNAMNLWALRILEKAKPETKQQIDKIKQLGETAQSQDIPEQDKIEMMQSVTETYIDLINLAYQELLHHRLDNKEITQNMVKLVDEFLELTKQKLERGSKLEYREILSGIMLERENDFFHPLLSRYIRSLGSN